MIKVVQVYCVYYDYILAVDAVSSVSDDEDKITISNSIHTNIVINVYRYVH